MVVVLYSAIGVRDSLVTTHDAKKRALPTVGALALTAHMVSGTCYATTVGAAFSGPY